MKCPRTVNDGKDRCQWEGDDPTDHASIHELCLLGEHFLRDNDVRVCSKCVTKALTDLADIVTAYAELGTVVEAAGFHMGGIPGGDALVMLAGGSIEGGGPDDDIQFRDPVPVLADLHSWERDWRETFGHNHFPAWRATVVSVTGYLAEWMWLAARTHDAFDDYVRDVRTLRSRLQHVAGLADDPYRQAGSCADCGGDLLREYRPPTAEPVHPRRGLEVEGLADNAVCRDCKRVYKPAEYGYGLVALAASCSGWVPVSTAADAARRPEHTIWTWQRRLEIPSACRLMDRRLVVEWDAVREVSATRTKDIRATGRECA